jgi:hypothetical protein
VIEVRATAEFKADFPDDGIEDKSGYLLFPGKGVTAAIAEMLRKIGCEVSDPGHAGEHGWELDISFRNESLRCQVTSMDVENYGLLFTDGPFMDDWSSKPAYLEAIAKLNLEMQQDPRFHDIRWSRLKGPDGPGAKAPLNMELDQLPELALQLAPRPSWFEWLARVGSRRKSEVLGIRNKAKIGTSFPEDAVREDEEIVQWGGKGVAAVIAEMLRRHGSEVSEPINAAQHGWVLVIRHQGHIARCQIEDGGGFIYLELDDRGAADHPEYVELIVQLNAELQRDSRFHDIRWYRRDAISTRGLASNSPVYPTS